MEAQVGDQVIIEGPKVGVPPRTGEIIEVRSGAGGKHYRVRWDDDRETIFFPSSDARIERPEN
jgi:hypothetical protein